MKKEFILVWGLSYLFCSILSPDMVKNVSPYIVATVFFSIGFVIIVGLILKSFNIYPLIGSVLLISSGLLMILGMWASWTGYIIWDVGLPNQTILQVNMAVLDLIAGVVLLDYGLVSEVNLTQIKHS